MKVIQIVPRIAAHSSGPSYSVTRLSESLGQANCDVELNVLEPLPESKLNVLINAWPVSNFPGAKRLGWSPKMKMGLREAATSAEIVHNHSLWMMPNIYCHAAARRGGCKLVFSPRGTLSAWSLARSRWRKRAVWWAGQSAALFGADLLHATSEKELEEIRAFGLKQPVAVIPNGVDLPEILKGGCERSPRTLLFLSRIHPTKNLDILLFVWQKLQARFSNWQLQIAGPLDGQYPRRMQRLARELGLQRINFVGEVKGELKSELYEAADLFVLPTNSENFGMAVAEALAHGTPVVVTRGTPWGEVEERGCGWWIEIGQAALHSTLETAMNFPESVLDSMGRKGRDWMGEAFAWTILGERMKWAYQWLLDEQTRPLWIDGAVGAA